MAGFLPDTRPLSESYGPDVVDDRPLEDPERELAAENFNSIKADVAYAARMTPLLKIRVSNNGTATVTDVVGPEGVTAADVTATRTALGNVTVDWSGTGVSGSDVFASARDATTYGVCFQRAVASTSVDITTFDGSAFDGNFTLWVW